MMKYCAAGNSNCRHGVVGKNNFFGQIFQIQTHLMQPYKVFMESDLKKMILDIMKFNIMKERGVTELLFFNEFHLNI